MEKSLYLLAKTGPVLAACADWRHWYAHAHREWSRFAMSKGSEGYISSLGTLVGLFVTDVVPDGWSVRGRGRGGRDKMLAPAKGKAGVSAREEIEALPQIPGYQKIREALGLPGTISYSREGVFLGRISVGSAAQPFFVLWGAEHGRLIVEVPDVNDMIAGIKARNPGVDITPGEWRLPDGVRLLTAAQKDLVLAQDRVAAEEIAA